MVPPSKPNVVPMLLFAFVFFAALVMVHLAVDSELARRITDLSILVSFFGGILLWVNRR